MKSQECLPGLQVLFTSGTRTTPSHTVVASNSASNCWREFERTKRARRHHVGKQKVDRRAAFHEAGFCPVPFSAPRSS